MAKKKYYGDSMRSNEGMLRENRSAVANLPQEVIYKPFPGGHDYLSFDLNDKLSGVDMQMRDDVNGAKRNKSRSKY